MAKNAPGKHQREGITLVELMDMFPDEDTAANWFAKQRWGDKGRFCPSCGLSNTKEDKRPRVYRCPDCKNRFSVRTGTSMERSKIPLRKWAIAIYLSATNLKGVSSMKLHRDLGITQKSAWFMSHRIREALIGPDVTPFFGPLEVDEAYIGGKRKNMSNKKRKELKYTGTGGTGKTIIIGAKDRATNKIKAKVISKTNRKTLHGFIVNVSTEDSTIYTDEARVYSGIANRNHETVNHTISSYVRDQAHTNGVESFWSMLKRGYHGTYHKMSAKHLQRYVNEFAGKHNTRNGDTADQMRYIVANMVGKRLMYKDLIDNNGLDSGART